jgi:hypothetical protein
MSRNLIPWLVAGGAAVAILYFETHRRRSGASRDLPSTRGTLDTANDSEVRNAALKYRPVGGSGEPYPDWVRMLDGKSGVYIFRETQNDGTTEVVYVGQSSTGRLYQTLTRHFQTWRRAKKFWTGQYTGSQSHDPGLTYDRKRITVAVRVLPATRALAEEARLIARLRPRDNLIGQPSDDDQDEAIPF